MTTETKTLIEIMNYPGSAMKDYHKGRLQGRLETLENFLEFIESDDNSWKKVDELEEEIKLIKDANVSGDEHGN